MLSTGVEALDSRLGGIEAGGRFVVLGPEGAGKSVLGLHFLIAGLERSEPCLLITASGNEAVDGRGLFLGFTPGTISSHPHLRVLDIHRAVDELGLGMHRNAPVEALRRIAAENGGVSRVVIDDLQGFANGTSMPGEMLRALGKMLEELGATSYLLASTTDSSSLASSDLEALTGPASAVIRLDQAGRGRRKFSFLQVRQKAFSTEPFLYTLRSGGGFAEDLPAYDREVDRALRKRVVILDENQSVPEEVLAALSKSFDLDLHTDLDGSLIELLSAQYGVLVLGVDPYDPERVFNLTYTLRKSGNGAPILFVSSSRGLRSMTRSRGLRMGGDDFILSELPPAEIVERIRITAHRGHHRRNGSVLADRQLQPVDEGGALRPLRVPELRDALTQLLGESPSPFFALVVLEPARAIPLEELWGAVSPQVRLRDGDLLSVLPDGTLALVLAQVDVDLARKVVGRVQRAHPALFDARRRVTWANPLQGDAIGGWVESLEVESGGG